MSGAVPGRARAGLMRGGLGLLSLSVLAVGAWALFLPRSFHEDFPSASRGWVSALGPYNGHLLADVGAMYLALGVLSALAAVSLGKELVRASLVAGLVFAVPHFVFHAATIHLHPLPIDRAGNLISLGFVVVLPFYCFTSTVHAERPRDEKQKARRAGNGNAPGGACGGLC